MRFTLAAALSAVALLTGPVAALALPSKPVYTPSSNLVQLAKLQTLMPKSTLPAPDGLQLKYVLLGIGTQNYTCLTGDESAAPGTTGAFGTFPFTKTTKKEKLTPHSPALRHRHPSLH